MALAAPVSWSTPAGWTDDFEAAKAQAAAEGKDLFLYFTGSEWCLPCVMMDKSVFSSEAFRGSAPEDFVLVEIDFPKPVAKPEPPKTPLMKQNRALQAEYRIVGFPTIILADADGRPYATTGYRPGGAETFLPHLDELRAKGQVRDRAMAKAAASEGLEKAKALDAALNVVGIEFALSHYADEIQAIIALDPDNAAELYDKYAPAFEAAQINSDFVAALELIDRGEYDTGAAHLEQIVGDYNLQGERRQYFKVVTGQVLMTYAKRPAAAAERFRDALAAAPSSPVVSQIEQLIADADAQAAHD